MKNNKLRIGIIISTFLLFILLVLIAFFCTFCENENTIIESSIASEVEELIVEETTTTTITSTETTTVDETTTTLVESTSTTQAVTETSQIEVSTTYQLLTEASVETTTETVFIASESLSNYEVTTTIVTTPLKTNEEIAEEVWQGLWGSGCERRIRLESAGYNYYQIQALVNERCKTKESELVNEQESVIEDTPCGLQISFVKRFTHGTYYAYGGPRRGGSGRQLIDCSQGSGGIKGSIASWYLYSNYGYSYKGERTKVYLEVDGYPQMDGVYYLDDSCSSRLTNTIDFFYLCNGNCPFNQQGVVQVDCYIIE